LAVRNMRRSVSLHIEFDTHAVEFKSWLNEQKLRIGAVINKSNNQTYLNQSADVLDGEKTKEKLRQLMDINKCFNESEKKWLMNPRFNGRDLIESCKGNSNLQRETKSQISAMESLSKQAKERLKEEIRTATTQLASIHTRIESKLESFELASQTFFEKKKVTALSTENLLSTPRESQHPPQYQTEFRPKTFSPH
uniref:Relaxase n=1 Tax=Macrostomum lignano TaxID=282301 RepID=A0A1I8GGQ6_9PLAT